MTKLEAMEILQKDLEKHCKAQFGIHSEVGVQFVNIVNQFLDNIKPASDSVLDESWLERSDKSYYNKLRILIFTPDYNDPVMRWRIIDSQFMDLCKDATHWKTLDDPQKK
jgi:hypothetical protein